LTVAEVRARGERTTRAGLHALSLLAAPLNVPVLQALAEGPRSLMDLRREAGSPPQSTMRCRLRELSEIGVLTRRRQDGFPGSLDYELTPAGRDLLAAAGALRSWLAEAPDRPIALGSPAAKSAIKALVEGWSTSMLRALAARPLSLTELDSLISQLSYPSIERRLGAMRLVGQIEPAPSRGRGTPYAVTGWMRRAIAPLAVAARWERLHLREQAAPVTHRDAEAAFLLAIPLLRLPAELSGSCRLVVEIPNGEARRLAGVLVDIEEGRVVSCVAGLRGSATAWASGSTPAWLATVIECDTGLLEIGGDCCLARALAEGMHEELFGAGARANPQVRP
jgi:DNA-binding HxlR family transcriptional regulator